MRRLDLAYDRAKFWENYWQEHGTDHSRFEDLSMYPIKMMLRHVAASDRILECGCGAGRVVRHFSGSGHKIVGLEYDVRALEWLGEADPSLLLTAGDGTRLPFPDHSFDVACAFGMVGALGEKTADAVSELRRVVRPGGKIIASVMLANIARKAQKALNHLTANGRAPEFYAWTDTEQGWANYFSTFGLKVIETDPMVSRYNVFYWTPFLRSPGTDLARARVNDAEYKLNALGELLWALHAKWMRRSLAAASTFVMVRPT
jgi:SAM-dependent methyltransferase